MLSNLELELKNFQKLKSQFGEKKGWRDENGKIASFDLQKEDMLCFLLFKIEQDLENIAYCLRELPLGQA